MDQNKSNPDNSSPDSQTALAATAQEDIANPAQALGASSTQPDNTPRITVGSSQEKVNKSALMLVVLLIVVLAGGAVFAYQRLAPTKYSAAKTTSSTNKTVTATPTGQYASVLVFQSTMSDTASSISIVGLDGKKLATIASKPTDVTFDASIDSSFNLQQLQGSDLVTADKAATRNFGVLTPDGKSQPIASSLAPLFNGSDLNLGQGGVITIGKSTVIGINSKGFVKADLISGKSSYLLTFTNPDNIGASGANDRLITTSRDGKTAYLFVNKVTVNGSVSKNVSLVTVDLATGKFTMIALPITVDPERATVSNDGKLVAYQRVPASGGDMVTHILNVATQQDFTIPGRSVAFPSGEGNLGMSFSPDNAFLAEVKDGDSGPGSNNSDAISEDLRVVSVSTHSVLQQVKASSNNVMGYGWAGEHTLIYITQPNSHGANYGTIPMFAHSMDAVTGKVFDFPQLGELDAVLNYSN